MQVATRQQSGKAASVVVLGTGGTIAGVARKAGDNVGYDAAQLGVADLLRSIPGVDARGVIAEQVAQINSKDMTHAIWVQLAARCAHWLAQPSVQGIVIAHGTDTLEETAWFLQSVLAPRKPVVLTCAMRPSTAASPDGPQNLADALAVARTPGARGVVMVASGTVHGARDVQKVHPYRVDAFDSADGGSIGHMREGVVARSRDWPAARGTAPWSVWQRKLGTGAAWPWVQVVMGHAGAEPRLIESLVQAGVRGLVVAGSGNGSVHEVWLAPLAAARKQGVRVWRTTRCQQGSVVPPAGTEHGASWDATTDLSPVKARVSLLLELLRTTKPAARGR